MFDFLKNSRAIRFLCSACLLCSLGSFDISADDAATSNVPVKVANAYLQGPLGFESNHITFEDDATITAGSGVMSDAPLKWKETKTIGTYSNSELGVTNQTLENAWANTPATDASTIYFDRAQYTSQTLTLNAGEYVIIAPDNTQFAGVGDQVISDAKSHLEDHMPPEEQAEQIFLALGGEKNVEGGQVFYKFGGEPTPSLAAAFREALDAALHSGKLEEVLVKCGYLILGTGDAGQWTIWKDGTGNIVGSSANETNAREQAWTKLKTSITDQDTQKAIVLASGWTNDTVYAYSTLQNSDEDSKLALFLKSGDDYVGATKEIDLSELGEDRFTLKDVKFYNADAPAKIEDESAATPLSYKPGVYELHAILTDKGDKTLISGTDEDNSDES